MTVAPRLAFTDLDGTLLDHETYAWRAAVPAIEALRRRGIPLVLASSKTRAELEAWRKRIGNEDPFISENGGALFVPAALGLAVDGAEPAGDYQRVVFGVAYPALRAALADLTAELHVRLRGFGDMPPAEVAERTGLAGVDLERCMKREFDEPFVVEGDVGEDFDDRLDQAARARGLRVTRGGRFRHLIGDNDKGRAARVLCEAFAGDSAPETVAAGDSENDLGLLELVDDAIVVARPDGSHAPALWRALPHARFTRAAGAAGFAEGMLSMIEEWERH
jgi:mannosyl-3-phosphoglycerate phosphatase